jgi:hypothetical protein
MVAQLSIGTSDERINLLDRGGFLLSQWRPTAGGHEATFGESTLADYRQLAAYRDITTIETFELKLRGNSADAAISLTQDLRRILRKALDYWATTWQTDVVYLAAQAQCETNVRYAVVVDARLEQDDNPYGQPFMQAGGGSVMDNLTLIVERGPWLENAPGTGTTVEISAAETYNSRTLGNVNNTGTQTPTSADEVFIANKRSQANLTNIHYWNQSAAAWSANLLAAALPTWLWPAPAEPLQQHDTIVFGIDTTVANSGPFCSLVFDIMTALTAGGGITIQWRYSTGGADVLNNWSVLNVTDNTRTVDAFDTTGVNSVHWDIPTDWTAQNPTVNGGAALGTTGFWVAAYVSAAAGAPTAPRQQNRDIYSIVWPYIEIESDAILGDVPAIARIDLTGEAAYLATGSRESSHFIFGARATDRGTSFVSYINLADEQNPTGITIQALGLTTSMVDYMPTATGRAILWNPLGVEAIDGQVLVTISSALMDHYAGRFHAYAIVSQSGGAAGDFELQLRALGAGVTFYTSDPKTVPTGFPCALIDFGALSLPTGGIGYLEADAPPAHYFYIDGECTAVAPGDLYFLAFVLMPTDEWAGEFIQQVSGEHLHETYFFRADSVGLPRLPISATVRELATPTNIVYFYRSIANAPINIRPNVEERLYLLGGKQYGNDVSAAVELAWRIQLQRNQRYLSMRGAR